MSHETIQILFVGELTTWLKIAQVVVDSPSASLQLHRAASIPDAIRRLSAESFDAILGDFTAADGQELLSAMKDHPAIQHVPLVALLPSHDPILEAAALSLGAAGCVAGDSIRSASIQEAIVAAIRSKRAVKTVRKGGPMQLTPVSTSEFVIPGRKIEVISHALTNLLCIISANAEILADQVDASHNAVRSVNQIKKATKTAAELMRQLHAP